MLKYIAENLVGEFHLSSKLIVEIFYKIGDLNLSRRKFRFPENRQIFKTIKIN
jgi:hypothetical protein